VPTRAFPFLVGELSPVLIIRFHSEEDEVRSCRKYASASFSAEDHDCRSLGPSDIPNDYSQSMRDFVVNVREEVVEQKHKPRRDFGLAARRVDVA